MSQPCRRLLAVGVVTTIVIGCSPAPPDRSYLDREFSAAHPSWNIVNVAVGEAPSGPDKYYVHFQFTTDTSDEINKVVWTVERSGSGFEITDRAPPLLPLE